MIKSNVDKCQKSAMYLMDRLLNDWAHCDMLVQFVLMLVEEMFLNSERKWMPLLCRVAFFSCLYWNFEQ